jgi:hypothetical protein
MKNGILLSLLAAVVMTTPAFACPAHHGKGACKSDAKCETKAPAKDAKATTSTDTAKTAVPAK